MDEQYYKWHKLSERKPTAEDANTSGQVFVGTVMGTGASWGVAYRWDCTPNWAHYWWPGRLPAPPTPPEKTQKDKDWESADEICKLYQGDIGLTYQGLVFNGVTFGREDERRRLAKEIMEHIDTEVENTRVSRGIFVSLIEIKSYLKTLID